MTDVDALRDKTFARWCNWIATIERNLIRALMYQEIWSELLEGFESRPDLNASFFNSFSYLYADSQCITIRRLCDTARDSASLARLIIELREHPLVLDRARFVEVHSTRGVSRDDAEEEWHRWSAGPGSAVVSPDRLAGDLSKLTEDVRHIVSRTNQRVAHLDARAIARLLRDGDAGTPKVVFGDIRKGLKVVAEVADHYTILLLGHDTDFVPAIDFDWKAPFRPGMFVGPPHEWMTDPSWD